MKISRRILLCLFGLWITTANATNAGKAITATLKLKERVPMEELARQVQTPGSERFGRFYEPLEIRQVAGPLDAEYDELLRGLKSDGFTIVRESPTRLWITVRGEVARFESTFHTQLGNVGPGKYRPTTMVHIPGHYSLIESVIGMDNTRTAFPRYLRQAKTKFKPRAVSQADIKNAYGFAPLYERGISGRGIAIAIATYDGYRIENVRQFFKMSRLNPQPTVETVHFNGVAMYDEQSAGETELDAEFAGMIAPGAHILVYPSATNDDAGEVQMYTAILDDNRAKIVNYSWGNCEKHLSPQHPADMSKVFYRALAQGVNIFAASGDFGSDACNDGTLSADWPSSHEGVISVGGTTLGLQRGDRIETGWSGSGGGISDHWELPAWQKNIGSPFWRRSFPDVSFNADPRSGQAMFTGREGKGEWMVVGGTSMAAPQWAGYMALVMQARRAQFKADLGFLNPIFYAMDPATRARTFNDVVKGRNGAYTSTPGWDAVTGWGSMQGEALLDYLVSL